MVQLGQLMMILELHRQGLSVTAIARRTGRDPETVRKYVERGIEVPHYGPRSVGRPGKLAPFIDFLRERVIAFPELSAVRLTREIRELGYAGVIRQGENLEAPCPTGGCAARARRSDMESPAGDGGTYPSTAACRWPCGSWETSWRTQKPRMPIDQRWRGPCSTARGYTPRPKPGSRWGWKTIRRR